MTAPRVKHTAPEWCVDECCGIVVVASSVSAIAGLSVYIFAPRRGRTAEIVGGVQTVTVTVKGGYSPDLVHVRQGVPLEITFDRQESGEVIASYRLHTRNHPRDSSCGCRTSIRGVPGWRVGGSR